MTLLLRNYNNIPFCQGIGNWKSSIFKLIAKSWRPSVFVVFFICDFHILDKNQTQAFLPGLVLQTSSLFSCKFVKCKPDFVNPFLCHVTRETWMQSYKISLQKEIIFVLNFKLVICYSLGHDMCFSMHI